MCRNQLGAVMDVVSCIYFMQLALCEQACPSAVVVHAFANALTNVWSIDKVLMPHVHSQHKRDLSICAVVYT